MKNIIVVGVSAAGISALSKLRELDKNSKITAITYEKEFPYNKCFLVDLLSNNKTEEQIKTKPEQFFKDNNIDLLLGKRVVKIISQNNQIILDDSAILDYDVLLLATGLQSIVPKIEGVDSKGVFKFYTFEDTRDIYNYVHTNQIKNAAIVGLGLTGVEVSDALTKLGIQLSVIDKNSRILANQSDREGSEFIQNLMQQAGIKLHLNSSVKKIIYDKNGTVNSIVLENGTEVLADMVIISVGSQFDKKLFQDAGIKTQENGVVVDNFFKTNFEKIYAAGDIVLIKDIVSGNMVRSCTWPDAVLQGVFVASNILGQPKEYPGTILINSSHFFDKEFISAGEINKPAYQEFVIQKNDSYYKICLNQEGHVTGFIMIGQPKNLSKIKRSILNNQPLDLEVLANFQEKNAN